MYVSKVIVFRALRIAASIAGKISRPLTRVSTRLPSTSGGPSSTPIERWNWGSAMAYVCVTRSVICVSPTEKLTASNISTAVAATVTRISGSFLVCRSGDTRKAGPQAMVGRFYNAIRQRRARGRVGGDRRPRADLLSTGVEVRPDHRGARRSPHHAGWLEGLATSAG